MHNKLVYGLWFMVYGFLKTQKTNIPYTKRRLVVTINQSGQSLIEVIVAASVGILVVTALTFATIFSLRNANFAKNSAQATKLAQEGLEKVKTLRDRDGAVSYQYIFLITQFSQLFSIITECPTNCYFYFFPSDPSGVLTGGTDANFELIPSTNFKRQFKIENTGTDQKKVTVIVRWTDFAGDHDSKLTTILRKL